MMSTRAGANASSGGFSLDEVMAQIRPTSEVDPYTSMCIYGRPKMGKTHFAASSGRRTLVVDCRDIGTETLRKFDNVQKFTIQRFPGDMDALFWAMKTQRTRKDPFEVIAIDNLTTLSSIVIRSLVGERSFTDPLELKDVPWTKVTQIMDNIIYDWRDLVMDTAHLVFLAQEKNYTVPNAQGTDMVDEIGPSVTPKVRETLQAAVSTIGRISAEEVDGEGGKRIIRRELLLGPNRLYVTGSRIKGLPQVMRQPTLAKILAIREANGEVPANSGSES
jgi:hypothetical protein